MADTWIDIGGGMSGYLATPTAGSGPGIVLLQEIFGVNAHMRDVADLWADEGYVVLAPDLFHMMEQRVELGYDGADLEKAFDFYGRFDMEQAVCCGALWSRLARTGPPSMSEFGRYRG